jgi:hypothetical protein
MMKKLNQIEKQLIEMIEVIKRCKNQMINVSEAIDERSETSERDWT